LETKDIDIIAVLGAGVMGPGLAQIYAMHGYKVNLFSRRQETLQTAASVIRNNLQTQVEAGRIGLESVEAILTRISFTNSVKEAVAGARYIVETVVEDREVKRKLYAELDAMCVPEAIIASNTSSVNIFELMVPARQNNTVIAHFFAPPDLIPLVEVVKSQETSNSTVKVTMELARLVGKTPVLLAKFIDSFLINRLQRVLSEEIYFLLDNGYATPEQIDLAVKASLAPRMMVVGVVQRMDFTGLDLCTQIYKNKGIPIEKWPRCLAEKVSNGDLGVKTGKGFYDYGGRTMEEVLKERDVKLIEVLKDIDRFIQR